MRPRRNVLLSQGARQPSRLSYLLQVDRADRAASEVLLEALSIRAGQPLFEVVGHDLHELSAGQFLFHELTAPMHATQRSLSYSRAAVATVTATPFE